MVVITYVFITQCVITFIVLARCSDIYVPKDFENNILEGDILDIPEENDMPALSTIGIGRNAILSEQYKWPNGFIPYEFADSYTAAERDSVSKAFESFRNVTCVRFVPKTAEHSESIMFYKVEGGCFASVGYREGRASPMVVNYASPCLGHMGAMQHELMHVMGLLHEQARPDRDEYIKVLWDNINEDYWGNFKKATTSEVTTYGIPYDYNSLMHYPQNAFSKNGLDTMVAKNGSAIHLGQSDGPTEYDYAKIRRLYNCSDNASYEK